MTRARVRYFGSAMRRLWKKNFDVLCPPERCYPVISSLGGLLAVLSHTNSLLEEGT
jgi:hypothetical protein